MDSVLDVKQLTKIYGSQTAVEHVSFTLHEHTSTALIGPNGAGKTTILSMLSGLVKQTSGTIYFEGQANQDIRALIGFLPQYPKFFPWLSALEFLEMAAGLSGVPKREAKERAQKTLEFVGLGDALQKRTGTFSGGMKQRLGLAQAIVHEPQLLLLDEPVSALDPVGRRQVMNLLKELQARTTILYSTHILNDAEEMTDQLLFLRQGALVEQGSLDTIRQTYADPKLVIEFETIEELERFCLATPWKKTVAKRQAIIDPVTEDATMADILKVLQAGSYAIVKVERQTASLEDIFLKVVAQP